MSRMSMSPILRSIRARLVSELKARSPSPRAAHARALAHAATRRKAAAASLRAECRIDALYWKSKVPRSLEDARALRVLGLAALP